MTRAEVMYLARAYSQVPSGVLSDTLAYKFQDQEEIRIWGEAARRAPSLLMTTQTVAYPALAEYVAFTTPAYRLMLVGTKADSGNRYTLFQQMSNIEFSELESSGQHANAGSQYKFHFNGSNLYLRPMPTQALSLLVYYTPYCTVATATTGNILGGNIVLEPFGEYMANRVALKLRMITGRNSDNLTKIVDDQDKDFETQAQRLQDAEPAHVGRTESYLTGAGASPTYMGADPF